MCCCAIWTYPCYDIVIYVDICTVVVGGELLKWKCVGVGADAALAFPLLSFALPFAFGFRLARGLGLKMLLHMERRGRNWAYRCQLRL